MGAQFDEAHKHWRENSKAILAEAKKTNKWRRRTKHNMLVGLGPRIAKLGRSSYSGCGFHYSIEQSFGKIIRDLAIPWEPCAGHCDKVKNDRIHWMTLKVLVQMLYQRVQEAEGTATERKL